MTSSKLDADKIAFLDVEASALHDGYPIEIGWARMDGTVGAVLIRPTAEWIDDRVWDDIAENVHGLTRDMLDDDGVSPAEALARVERELRGCMVYSDAPGFDAAWLDLLIEAAGATASFRIEAVSALELVRRSFGSIDANPILERLETEGGHAAAGDAAALAAAYALAISCDSTAPSAQNIAAMFAEWREKASTAAPWRANLDMSLRL